KEPMTNMVVTFQGAEDKPFAALATVKTPYPWTKDPDKITVLIPGREKPEEKEATRFTPKIKQLVNNPPNAIPLDPKSMPASTNPVNQLNSLVYSIRTILEGNKEDPRNETQGLLKDGDDLAVELHKAGLAH